MQQGIHSPLQREHLVQLCMHSRHVAHSVSYCNMMHVTVTSGPLFRLLCCLLLLLCVLQEVLCELDHLTCMLPVSLQMYDCSEAEVLNLFAS